MDALQARIDSFLKSKRVKKPTAKQSSATVAVKWPHPDTFKATPTSLADAGFYFNPSWEDRDNVTCFMCGKEIGDWDESDDPFDIHWDKCRGTCPWAIVRCGLKVDVDEDGDYVFPDTTRLPSSKAMEKARLDTFTSSGLWPHDAVKKHGANSKKMSQAGFVFTPQSAGDDTASCLYCNVALSGWDDDDDPMQEHRKRVKKSGMPCPFFSTAIAPSSKPPSRAGSTRAVSRSRSKKPDPPSDSEELAASETPAATSRPVKPKLEGKGKRAVAAASTSRRVTRGASAAAQGATEPAAANEDEDDPMPAPKRTASRSVASKSKAVAKETAPEDPPVVRRMASRSKAKTKVVPTIEEQAEVEDERAPSPVVSGPSKSRPKPKRIPSQSKPKSAAPITVISDSEPDNSPGDTHMQDASSMHEPSGSLPQSDDMPPSSSRDDLPNSNSQSDHVAATAMPGIELTAAIEPQRSMQTPSPVPDSHGTPRQPLSPPTTLSGLPASLGSKIFSMPEAEQSMTVEEWIHHEIRLQHRKMEVDGRASIALFKQRALEVRQRIEAL